jgi:hypothetical protein
LQSLSSSCTINFVRQAVSLSPFVIIEAAAARLFATGRGSSDTALFQPMKLRIVGINKQMPCGFLD